MLAPAAARRDEQRDFLLTERDFDKIRALIHRRAGISLGSQKREMVYSRLARWLRALQLVDFATYRAAGVGRPLPEWELFVNALTTNLTSFFREAHHFPAGGACQETRPALLGLVRGGLHRRGAVFDRHHAGRGAR